MIFRKKIFYIILLLLVASVSTNVIYFSQGAPATSDKLQLFSKIMTYVKHNYVESVDENKLLDGAIRGMLAALDPHSAWLTAEQYKELQTETEGEFGGVGIEIIMKKNILTIISPIEGTPGHRAGLMPGDIIVKIEGHSTSGMEISEAVNLMRGKPKTKVTITIMRSDFKEPKDFVIERDVIRVQSVKFQILEPGYGYIRIAAFQENTSKQLLSALYSMTKDNKALLGLILDLRNNPGGLLPQALEVSDVFLDEGKIVSTVGKDASKPQHHYANKEGSFVNFPMAVLINGGSASASEIVAGALQDHQRAIILGQKSFGKGSVQSIAPMEGGSALKLTIARFATPKGKFIQEHGITPDGVIDNVDMEEYKKTIKDINSWREIDFERHLEGVPDGKDKKKDEPKAEILDKDFQVYQALRYLKLSQVAGSLKYFHREISVAQKKQPLK
ncbi:MAG: S41 family peptidase [Deltaproteobacteria bacterium]|nr:S41 family peptidase [Deltaproteobacteria bacterium]